MAPATQSEGSTIPNDDSRDTFFVESKIQRIMKERPKIDTCWGTHTTNKLLKRTKYVISLFEVSVAERMHLSAYRVTCTRPRDSVESHSSQGDQRSSLRSRERRTPRPTTNPHVVFMDAADFYITLWIICMLFAGYGVQET